MIESNVRSKDLCVRLPSQQPPDNTQHESVCFVLSASRVKRYDNNVLYNK